MVGVFGEKTSLHVKESKAFFNYPLPGSIIPFLQNVFQNVFAFQAHITTTVTDSSS